MKPHNKLSKLAARRLPETGFTLVELVVVIGIIGIIAAIAIPVYTNIMNVQHEAEIKQKLSSAAVMLEQEAIDNGGYVPKYVPNEIMEDPVLKRFAYEHKDRVEWCVIASVTKQSLIPFFPGEASLWFASSKNTTPSQSQICGGEGYEPLEGSSAPWSRPVVSTPQVASHSTTWPVGAANASAAVASTVSTCTFAPGEEGLFADVTITMEYRSEVKNMETGRTKTVISTFKPSATGHTLGLSGFYPGDRYEVRVQSKCSLSREDGFAWEYSSAWSTPKSGTVAKYTIPAPTFNATSINVKTGGKSVLNSGAATWKSNLVCPAGSTTTYDLSVKMPGSTLAANTYNGLTSNALSSRDLTNSLPGYRHTFTVLQKCTYPATGGGGAVVVTSPVATNEIRAALRAPAGQSSAAGFTTAAASNQITPDGYTPSATGFECATGTLVHEATVTNAAGSVIVAKANVVSGTTRTHNAQFLKEVNKNVYVSLETKCSGLVDGLTQNSPISADKSKTTLAIKYRIPPVPPVINSTTFVNDAGGKAAIKNDRLRWTAVKCASGTPNYQVRHLQKSSKEKFTSANYPIYNAASAQVTFGASHLKAGGTAAFDVRARCTNDVGSSAWTAYVKGTGSSWTTNINTPTGMNIPTKSTNEVRAVKWKKVTCQAGATPQYRILQTMYGTTTDGTWRTSFNTSLSANLPKWRAGYPLRSHLEARCVGPDKTSAVAKSGVYPVRSPIPTPWPWREPMEYRTINLAHNCSTWPGTSAADQRIEVTSPVFGYKSVYGTRYANTGTAWGASTLRLKVSCKTQWVNSPIGINDTTA